MNPILLKTDVPSLIKNINGRIEEILRAALEHQMQQALKPMVREAATMIARNLRGMVAEMHDYREDKIHLLVRIDGVDEVIAKQQEGQE